MISRLDRRTLLSDNKYVSKLILLQSNTGNLDLKILLNIILKIS